MRISAGMARHAGERRRISCAMEVHFLKKLLAPLVGDASPVTVIGLCKNAGKTTAMRRLMAELEEECLGLTSVGRDGEGTDLVTGTESPTCTSKPATCSPRPGACCRCAT